MAILTDTALNNAFGNGTTAGSKSIYTSGNIQANKVYNAVWNDLTDRIPVDEDCDLEYGRVYCFDGTRYYKSTKYLDEGIIGIHSDTGGLEMGHKQGTRELQCSVAGFVLAFVDRDYPAGTPLTCTENGCLTEISLEDKVKYPERILGTFWKSENSEEWGPEGSKVLVRGRKWVKVR